MNNTVTALLAAEGFAPRLGFAGFAAAARLADAVALTVSSPIRRALFVAEAAGELARLDYRPFEGLEFKAANPVRQHRTVGLVAPVSVRHIVDNAPRSEHSANLALAQTVLACHGWVVGRHALSVRTDGRALVARRPGLLARVLKIVFNF